VTTLGEVLDYRLLASKVFGRGVVKRGLAAGQQLGEHAF
jgi:hypothetical protein